MGSSKRGGLLNRTILYGIIASLLVWLIYFKDLRLGDLGKFLPMSPQMAAMNLDTLLLPLLVSITIFYLASILGIFFEGVFSEVLVGTLYAAGFASFFALFLVLQPGETINQAGYLLSGAFGVILLYNITTTVARQRKSQALKAVAVSATIFGVGQIVIRLLSLLMASSGASMAPGLA